MGNFNNRTIVIGLIMVLLGIIYVLRLFMLQVYDPSYKFSAESNARRKITEFPSRGLIYDRNQELMVSNQAVYDIMVVPRETEPLDTFELATSMGIELNEARDLFDRIRQNLRTRKISSFQPSVFYKQMTAEQYGYFQEKLFKFKGFFGQRRIVRKYEYPTAANILGYVGEISEKQLKERTYYSQGDYVGISGIEKTYEKSLRGRKGARFVLVDVHGRQKGAFRDGRYDSAAVSGKDLTLTLDHQLQQYGEKLMQNKVGSIVAIEPSTGEILTMVSSPSYDPSLLVGRKRNENFPKLANDTLYPLFNRPLQSGYPPGSTFKTLMALIGLQEGVVNPETSFGCQMGYHTRALSVGCHSHPSPLKLPASIQMSCNAYYCHTFRRVLDNPVYGSPKTGLDVWKDYLVNFGFGYKLGTDLSNEGRGFVPNSNYYDKIYNGSWGSLTVISLAIGQGELLTTPIQMANMAAAIANKGHWYIPHVAKKIENDTIPSKYKQANYVGIDSVFFKPVIEGMEQAVWGGAGSTARIAQIPGITICGKTGTAENPHGDDHSIFIAFAPKENPQIAVATYVENGTYGSTYGAPISSLIIEKYLNGEIHRTRKWIEQRMLDADLIHESND
ncbi:penicillin-binding protein 2 [Marinilabilia rubra]|uniref:Penicillin-binding protein 2 n=1 Tax=Marinilabilia rubra TaxID=2162893 RepID=A0A2U2BDH6_9BACT|nr:penicillin-binding protein 2 [Marinilabilia rubra]PWE01125.1 penicillin-binding protein 2 [Marinilabilia rubra]